MSDFTNKTAVIIGAGGGVGSCLLEELASAGAKIIAVYRKISFSNDKPKLKNVSEMECDLKNQGQIESLFKSIKSIHTSIDFLINCSAVNKSESLNKSTDFGFDEDILINLASAFRICLYGSQIMNNDGAIVNISSIRARGGTNSGLGYAASKAGIINLTQSLALQLATRGIRANCVVPSAIYPTKMSIHWSEEKRSKIISEIPLRRLATPNDVVNAILFLLSSKSSFITGVSLDVNGGEKMI